VIDGDAGSIEIEPVGRADAAGGEQQHLGRDVAAVSEPGDDLAMCVLLDRIDLGAEP
jgi:hypothetical protein